MTGLVTLVGWRVNFPFYSLAVRQEWRRSKSGGAPRVAALQDWRRAKIGGPPRLVASKTGGAPRLGQRGPRLAKGKDFSSPPPCLNGHLPNSHPIAIIPQLILTLGEIWTSYLKFFEFFWAFWTLNFWTFVEAGFFCRGAGNYWILKQVDGSRDRKYWIIYGSKNRKCLGSLKNKIKFGSHPEEYIEVGNHNFEVSSCQKMPRKFRVKY